MKNLNWLVQNTNFQEEFGYHNFIAAIDAAGQKRIDISQVFWDSTIDLKLTGLDPSTVIPFGNVSFMHYGLKNGWQVYWDPEYTYSHLWLALGKNFINHDMVVGTLDELETPTYDGKCFVKENAGSNFVKGGVINCYDWPQVKDDILIKNQTVDKKRHDYKLIDTSTEFCIAAAKPITEEYRCWCINGKVVTSSRYITEDREIRYTNTDDNLEVMNFAQAMVNELSWLTSMRTYTIDLFRTNGVLKVGELNCINCSGWYAVDTRKIVEALLE